MTPFTEANPDASGREV